METEKQPRAGSGWIYTGRSPHAERQNSMFERGRFRVISGLGPMELPQSGGKIGPTWHASLARRGSRRPTNDEVRKFLRDFDLVGAEEDNHMPGLARHFFQPVDPAYHGVCDCKTTEATIVEPDGHRWQNATDGSRCGGCEFERISGTPCKIHATTQRETAR